MVHVQFDTSNKIIVFFNSTIMIHMLLLVVNESLSSYTGFKRPLLVSAAHPRDR